MWKIIKIKNICLILVIALVMTGCKDALEGINNDQNQGEINLKITQVNQNDNQYEYNQIINSLKINIQKTDGTILREWETINDVPERIVATSSTYIMAAQSRKIPSLPCFDSTYYYGQEKFFLEELEALNVNLKVETATTMAQIELDTTSFNQAYKNYYVELRTTSPNNTSSQWLRFNTQDSLKIGNFLPGTIRFKLVATSLIDEKIYEFYPSSIQNCQAGELRKIKLKVNITGSYNTLLITTQHGYSKEEELNFVVPGTALPKPEPSIRCTGFVNGASVETEQGYSEIAGCEISSYSVVGYKNFILNIQNDKLIEQLGGISNFELIGITPENQTLLNNLGITWDSRLNDPATASELVDRVTVNFDGVFATLTADKNSESTKYPFAIDVKDNFDQYGVCEITKNRGVKLIAQINKPVFGVHNHGKWNYWTHHNEFRIYAKTNSNTKPILWKKTLTEEWTEVETFDFKTLQQQDTDTIYTSITGLEPHTTHTYKLTMGEHETPEFSGTNESPETIPNGDMETWYNTLYSAAFSKKIPYYQPYENESANQWWATNNDRTTSYRTTSFVYNYNSFPAVSHTITANSGTFAAELRSTSASNIDALNAVSTSQSHSQVPGMLYIGEFEYKGQSNFRNDGLNYGKPYNSRPKSFSYYYTYDAYQETESYTAQIIVYNDDTQIGYGIYTSPAGTDVTTYTQNTVEVIYSNRELPATKLTVIFETTNIFPAPVRKTDVRIDYGTNDGGWYSPFWGSLLRIDDVTLNYGEQEIK